MTKAKNIEYLESFKKKLDDNVKKMNRDLARLDMIQQKDKDDLQNVKDILKDLEKNNNGI